MRVATASLGSVTVAQLDSAVADATKAALSAPEQSEAAVARGMTLGGTIELSLPSGASGAAEQVS